MSFIKSRKHSISRSLSVMALLAMTAPMTAHAQVPAEAAAEDNTQASGPQERREEQAQQRRGREQDRRNAPPRPRRDDEPEQVIVTGADGYHAESLDRKSTAAIIDTPQTIQIVNEELIRDQGATTLAEALRNSPGVGTFFLGENGNTTTGDAIFIRGSDASGSIFVDGVRDIGSMSRDTFNIEQIEVLKGAAGADIGRGAATGAINLVTKRPTLGNGQSGSLGIGEGDYLRGTADLNWRLGETSGLRLNFLAQDAGVAGRDAIKAKRWGIAPTVGFGIGGDTRLFVSYMHIDQDNVPDGGVLTIGMPGYSTPNPGTRDFLNTAARVDSKNFYGTKDDRDHVEADTVSVIFERDIGANMNIANVTRWGQTEQQYQLSSFMAGSAQLATPNPADPNTWTITRNINNKDSTNVTLTNQTNLRADFATGPVTHSVSTGVEFISEMQKTRGFATSPGTYPPVSVYNPNPNVGGYTRLLSGAFTKGETDTIGLYVNDTITIVPQFLINAGLRLDSYETDYKSVAVTGVATPFKAEDDMVSGKFGAVYKPTEAGSIYASYAVTKQPPGGANFTVSAGNATNANNPNVDPQEAKTTEGGVKWNFFDAKLLVTGSVYRTEYSDVVQIDSVGNPEFIGAKQVQGVELGVVGQITPSWNISAGYTTMDTKVKGTPAVTADGSTDLNYTPSDTFTLWSTYALENGLTFGGGASYVGEMKRGTDGAVGTPKFVESHAVIDGMIKYPVTDRVGLQLNIYNLLDEDYAASINKSGYRYTPGVARSVRLTLNVGF